MSETIAGPIEAIVLLRTDPKIESNLLSELKEYKGVTEARMIYGPYDIYSMVHVESYEELNDLVLNKIRRLYGVKSTTTCYLAE